VIWGPVRPDEHLQDEHLQKVRGCRAQWVRHGCCLAHERRHRQSVIAGDNSSRNARLPQIDSHYISHRHGLPSVYAYACRYSAVPSTILAQLPDPALLSTARRGPPACQGLLLYPQELRVDSHNNSAARHNGRSHRRIQQYPHTISHPCRQRDRDDVISGRPYQILYHLPVGSP